jgi:transposase
MHITQGDSRDHRPDLHQVMLELLVEPQAGLPLLRQPLRGTSSEAHAVGQVVKEPMAQLHTTSGTTSLVADRALYPADKLQKLAETQSKWLTRVPARLSEAQAALVQAALQTLAALTTGSRYHSCTSTYGGVAQRGMLIDSEHRHTQAQRTVDKQLRKQGQREVAAFQTLCRMPLACEADAQQAFATCTHGLQATCLHEGAVHASPRYGKRGRPRHDEPPAQLVYTLAGALASSITVRPPLVDQQSCCILATNELDDSL